MSTEIKIWWRVTCEFCPHMDETPVSRSEAIQAGHAHVADVHSDDSEWGFRIQRWRKGITNDTQARIATALKRLEEIDGPL